MIAYLIIIISLILGFFIFNSDKSIENKERNRIRYINMMTIILIAMSGLRNLAVGNDTYGYMQAYNDIFYTSWSEIFQNFITVYVDKDGKDAGYPLLEKIFQIPGLNFRWFLLAIATFTFFTIRKLLVRFTKSNAEVFFSVLTYMLLFYTFMSITGIRQTISICLSIHCYFCILKKQWGRFILFAIIAFTIHKSAIIIVLYPLIIRQKVATLYIFSTIILFFAFEFRAELVALGREEAGYERSFEAETPWKLIILYSALSIVAALHYFMKRDRSSFTKEYLIMFKLFIPTFAMIPLLGNDSIVMREVLYTSIFSLILIPRIVLDLTNRAIILSLLLSFFLIFQTLLMSSPYCFYWQPMQLGPNYYNRSYVTDSFFDK